MKLTLSTGAVIEGTPEEISRAVTMAPALAGGIVYSQEALLGIEVDGKHFRISVRDAVTPDTDEPDSWKTFAGWYKEGWRLSDQTGNLFHGALVKMRRAVDWAAS